MTTTSPNGLTNIKPVIIWLKVLLFLVVLMFFVGSITRLTGSGLSITEWKPIMGAIPPLNSADWEAAFSKYQETTQFKLINSGMALSEFKWIFFWEWFHRLLGRFLGLAFAFPFLVFYLIKSIPLKWRKPILGLFLLGGMQGLVGWIMVMSGLDDKPYVSHIRLAIHFFLAITIACSMLWCILGLKRAHNTGSFNTSSTANNLVKSRTGLNLLGVGIVIQVLFGAFTAGLKAGYQFQTFPKMGGHWVPIGLWDSEAGILNVFNNPITVQWIHRLLGSLLFGYAAFLAVFKEAAFRRLSLAIGAQFGFGIFIVLTGIPVWAGVVHQLLGVLICLEALRLFWWRHSEKL